MEHSTVSIDPDPYESYNDTSVSLGSVENKQTSQETSIETIIPNPSTNKPDGCKPNQKQPCQATIQIYNKGKIPSDIQQYIESTKNTRFKFKDSADEEGLRKAITNVFHGAVVIFEPTTLNKPDMIIYRDSSQSDIISTVNFVYKDRNSADTYLQLGYLRFVNDKEQQRLHDIIESYIKTTMKGRRVNRTNTNDIPSTNTVMGGGKHRKGSKKTHKKKRNVRHNKLKSKRVKRTKK